MAEHAKDDTDPDQARLLAIYHGWKRAMGRRLLPGTLRQIQTRDVAIAATCLFLLCLQPLDEAIWLLRGPFPWRAAAPRSLAEIAAFLLAVTGLQIRTFYHLFDWRSRGTTRFRRWIVAACALAGGVPVIGYFALPVWSWIEERQPPWAVEPGSGSERLALSATTAPVTILRRRGRAHLSFAHTAVLYVAGFLGFLLLCLWLGRRAETGPAEHRLTIAAAAALHLLTFGTATVFLRDRAVRASTPRMRYRALAPFALAFLIPVPFLTMAGTIPLLAFEPLAARSGTLTWRSLIRRRQTARMPLWLELEDELRRSWAKLSWSQRIRGPSQSAARGLEPAGTEIQILRVYDLALFSLVLDAACLGWGLAWLSRTHVAWALALQATLSGLTLTALALCGIAFGAASVRFLREALRLAGHEHLLDRPPIAATLAKNLFAFAAGLFAGSAVSRYDPRGAGALAMLVCTLLIILKVFLFTSRLGRPRSRWRSTRWRDEAYSFAALFGLQILSGFGIFLEILPEIFTIWLLSWPLRALLLGRWLLPWLLRPFSWRDLFNSALSRCLRADLALLTASALLPGGALAAPAGLSIRHRRWAEAQAVWAALFRKAGV